jgi:hypothetical protein
MADAFGHTYIPRSWKEIVDCTRTLWAVVRRCIPRSWSDVVDFALILWVLAITDFVRGRNDREARGIMGRRAQAYVSMARRACASSMAPSAP